MHPRTSTLIAYRDRELTGRKAQRVAQHCARCARCRSEYERLGGEAALLACAVPGAAGFDPEPGLSRLLAAVASWEQTRDSQAAASPLRERLRAQLQIYFGSQTARLADAPGCDERELLARAECLLSTFLGRANAAGVLAQILDVANGGLAAGEAW